MRAVYRASSIVAHELGPVEQEPPPHVGGVTGGVVPGREGLRATMGRATVDRDIDLYRPRRRAVAGHSGTGGFVPFGLRR